MTADRSFRAGHIMAAVLGLGVGACESESANMMATPGNALSEAQIEQALGPETPAAAPEGTEPGNLPDASAPVDSADAPQIRREDEPSGEAAPASVPEPAVENEAAEEEQ